MYFSLSVIKYIQKICTNTTLIWAFKAVHMNSIRTSNKINSVKTRLIFIHSKLSKY